MEFHFPTGGLDAARILNLIRNPKSGPPASSRTAVSPAQLQGFLKGFIDLIFRFEGRYHVVDWKSNLLGNRAEDYAQEAMQCAIQESCYDLQYYIYTVALDKYLRQRLSDYDYDQHFGGVHYVFLRGLAPDRPELGVFHDRPSAGAIQRLAVALGNVAEVKS